MKSLLLSLLVVASMLSSSTALAVDVVRVGNLKFAHYGAVSYMKELAPKYHLKIVERMFPKGIDMFPAIVAGEIDVAASAADGAVAARAAGVPVYVTAGFAKGGARIVGRRDRRWRSVADLKGQKVGVARGGAQELVLLAELGKYGLSYSERPGKDVTIVYLAYADLNEALVAHDVDAICQSEPQSAQAISKGFGVEIVKPYDTILGEPIRTLMMTERMYARKGVAERFMKCFVEATHLFIKKPALAEWYVRENMFEGELSSQDYRFAIANSPYSYDLSVQHIQTTTNLMVKYGIGRMARPPVAREFVRLDMLEKAKKSLNLNHERH